MKIGEFVANYRESHNLSLRDFAKRCDLSHVIIAYIEKGERSNGDPYLPRFDTVRKLARGMGISAEQLISQCDDFDLDISVGVEETPIFKDLIQSQSIDEIMLLQAYRMIPVEYRIEAMQAIFKIKDKHEDKWE